MRTGFESIYVSTYLDIISTKSVTKRKTILYYLIGGNISQNFKVFDYLHQIFTIWVRDPLKTDLPV